MEIKKLNQRKTFRMKDYKEYLELMDFPCNFVLESDYYLYTFIFVISSVPMN